MARLSRGVGAILNRIPPGQFATGGVAKSNPSGALEGMQRHTGARFNPMGSGPTMPSDSQSTAHLQPDDWDQPCGTVSATPRVRR
jgi:hypothetical protein